MRQTYSIDLIDRSKRKYSLGSVTKDSVKRIAKSGGQLCVSGALRAAPVDKQVYLKTASTHGDIMKLRISNELETYQGDFCISFFDPQSQKAIFRSVGGVNVIA